MSAPTTGVFLEVEEINLALVAIRNLNERTLNTEGYRLKAVLIHKLEEAQEASKP